MEPSERHAELYERFVVVVALHSPIEQVGMGHYQTVAQIYGDVDGPRSCAFAFAPLVLLVVRL